MENKRNRTECKKKLYDRAEIGTIRKNLHGRIRVALVYPNTYHVGMSNLGFQSVYYLLNAIDNLVCERFFLPNNRIGNITSIESGSPLTNFHVVAFSISFENDYLNTLSIFESTGIPMLSDARGDSHPLVIAGGIACILNPEPIASFIDCFLLGDAQQLVENFFAIYDPHSSKDAILKKIVSNVHGVYVPSFYNVSYNGDNTIKSFIPKSFAPETIRHSISKDKTLNPAFSAIITPDTTFADTFLIEVTKGCPHGCRFCSAGFIYRPPRFCSYSLVENLIKNIPEKKETHFKQNKIEQKTKFRIKTNNNIIKLGLVGAAVSDYPDIDKICDLAEKKNINISFSSLRADALTPKLINSLKQNSVKTATIAPEAGSERMRQVINKGITEEQILLAVKNLVENSIPNIKLYFMIGLPTETIEDIEAIIDLSKKIKNEFLQSSKTMKKIGQITVSINPFIPKPVTPFQWAPMDSPKLLKKKIKIIKNGLRRVPNIRIHADTPRSSYINALLSRADRKVGQILLNANKTKGNWANVLKNTKINPDFYVLRKYSEQEILPWDFIDHGIKKSFLLNEYNRAIENKTSPPCPMKPCAECKICMAI